MKIFLFWLLVTGIGTVAQAQSSPTLPVSDSASIGVPTDVAAGPQALPSHNSDAPGDGMTEQGVLAICILGFGLLAIAIEIAFIRLMGEQLQMDAFDALRLITVTLIIVGALFASMATFESERTAAITGLLGTLAGYLLARSSLTKEGAKPDGSETTSLKP